MLFRSAWCVASGLGKKIYCAALWPWVGSEVAISKMSCAGERMKFASGWDANGLDVHDGCLGQGIV